MRGFIAVLALLLMCSSVRAEHIFPVGDSVLDYVYQQMVNTPPNGYTIDTTGQSLVYAGKALSDWTAGRGTGICAAESFYGCLEVADANTTIDVILIIKLGQNDLYNWHNETYADMATYLAAWNTFYGYLHTDFPNAEIVHITGHPIRVENNGTQCGSAPLEFYGGPISPAVNVPDCADSMECVHESNASYRGFKNQLIAAAPEYVTYIDTWEDMATIFTAAQLTVWQDTFVTDCIHINYYGLEQFWNDFVAADFGALMGYHVTAKNIELKNVVIR